VSSAFFSSSKLLKRLHDLCDTDEKGERESAGKRGKREVEVEIGDMKIEREERGGERERSERRA
jgi:hypothetical protein